MKEVNFKRLADNSNGAIPADKFVNGLVFNVHLKGFNYAKGLEPIGVYTFNRTESKCGKCDASKTLSVRSRYVSKGITQHLCNDCDNVLYYKVQKGDSFSVRNYKHNFFVRKYNAFKRILRGLKRA